MHFKISLMTIFLSFLALTNAVNLYQHTRPRCYGSRSVCRNIGPRVCCQSVRRVFVSGSCQGCTSTDFHITWNRVRNLYCGRSAAATNGNRCISGGSNLRGHSWCRLCRTITRRGENEEATCTSTAEPDALEIGSRWFSVNETVSENDMNALWELWEREAPDDSVPQNLLRYQTEVVDDEIDEVQAEGNVDEELGEPDVGPQAEGPESVAGTN